MCEGSRLRGVVAPTERSVLVGREKACRRIDQVLAEAQAGRRGVLVLRGEPGVGKTAVLGHAREQAAGMRLLEMTAMEVEATVAFLGLIELLHPLRGDLDRCDGLLAALLDGALPETRDRFAVGAALLRTLAALADREPLVILLDDLHWLDADSRDALLFAVRRLRVDAVAVVAATRLAVTDDPATTGLPDWELDGLAEQDLAVVLEDRHGPVAPAVVSRIWQETAGNPLAASEIARELSTGQLAGVTPLPPVLSCATAVKLFAPLLSTLSRPACDLLRLLAIASGARTEAALAAAGQIDLGLEALDELDDAGLIDLASGRVVLCHPLLRGAVTADCPARTLRSLHTALADALAPDPTAQARRVGHLAAATRGPSSEVAAAVAEFAATQCSASGHAAASAAYEQAALLTTSADSRVGYLIAAAERAHLAGDRARAGALAHQARPGCRSSADRARLHRVDGAMLYHSGYPLAASEALACAARLVADDDPAEACRLYAAAAGALYDIGQELACVSAAAQAAEFAQRRGLNVPPDVRLILGLAQLLTGQAESGLDLAVTAAIDLNQQPDDQELTEFRALAGVAFAWIGDASAARRVLLPLVDQLRRTGALGALPTVLTTQAYCHLWAGRAAWAYAAAAEAVNLAHATGTNPAKALGLLAMVEAYLGRADDSRYHARQARHLGRQTEVGAPRQAAYALGLLELEQGRPADALPYLLEANSLDPAATLAENQVSYGIQFHTPALIEAYLRSNTAVPDWLADAVGADIHGGAVPSLVAVAERCVGMLADADGFGPRFTRALELYRTLDLPIDTARTELAYGERLRRLGRRADARVHLRRALDLFDETGALLWTERARAELRAAGNDTPAPTPSAAEALTPQELQIARTVAAGATNKEAAAALFLSEKTVEMHLSRIYRKLGLRSRAELARALAP